MWMLVLKAVLTILPIIVQAVRDGRIRKAAEDEVLAELQRAHKARVDAAAAARDDVLAGRVPVDPHDPNRRD
jgi:hypothetical protein